MKTNLAYLSLLVNIYYIGSWIFIINKYPYEARDNAFCKIFPLAQLSPIAVNIFLILFSIFSIIILSKKSTGHRLVIIVQAAFILLFLWQMM